MSLDPNGQVKFTFIKVWSSESLPLLGEQGDCRPASLFFYVSIKNATFGTKLSFLREYI